MNLIAGINTELYRAKELLEIYEDIPSGWFGVAVIKQSIEQAEQSIESEDINELLGAYNNLKKLK